MSRRDAHFDAMVRHLGVTYYQTLHGMATATDVSRAVAAVAAEDGRLNGTEVNGPARAGALTGQAAGRRLRHHPWRVRDVMTTDVVTVDRWTPYKQVAKLMTEHRLNAMPVLTKNRHVAGMVSEADILRKQERGLGHVTAGIPRWTRRQRAQAEARTAGELMTAPAITIHPDAPLGSAARLMNGHHIRRLPVVDDSGQLLGVVSRRDLLSVFLRPDDQIAAEVRDVLADVLLADPAAFSVSAKDGAVTLSGILTSKELIPVATRLASEVDGVVSVTTKLSSAAA